MTNLSSAASALASGGSALVGSALIVAGSALVGAVHALLPDHWIPYVVLSRAKGWDLPRTLSSVVAGGVAHLGSTAVLGVAIAYAGVEALQRVGPVAELAGAGLLAVFGAVLALRGLVAARRAGAGGSGHGHVDGHDHAGAHEHAGGHVDDRGHAHDHDEKHGRARGPGREHLLQGALLGVRPCAEAIPVFLAATAYGLTSSLLSVLAWVAATLGTMVAVVWVSSVGLRGLRADFLARHGEVAAGAVILATGLAVFLALVL